MYGGRGCRKRRQGSEPEADIVFGRFVIENICRPDPVFRPAGFTPPPRLNAASELRLSDLAAESRPARHRPFHERNALAEGQKNAKKYAERNIRRQRRVEVQGLFSPMESPLRIPSLLPPLPP